MLLDLFLRIQETILNVNEYSKCHRTVTRDFLFLQMLKKYKTSKSKINNFA